MTMRHPIRWLLGALALPLTLAFPSYAQTADSTSSTDRTSAADSASAADVPLFHVHETRFEGPTYTAQDSPARDVELVATWRHEGGTAYDVHGFWDGDGEGGVAGNVFKVRFTPTEAGTWTLADVRSNVDELDGQHEGTAVEARTSEHAGFWVVDEESAGARWFRRSDGSHPYVIGNTMYSFLSETGPDGPTGSAIQEDVRGSAVFFNKLRFSLFGDIYPHPTEKPFLDDEGEPTDDGNFSHRPNPTWFHERADLAVRTAFEEDVIADLILAGPDSEASRSTLLARENGGDPGPWLRYVAARYGAYPNVWMAVSNEYDIRTPTYAPELIRYYGHVLQDLLPYPTPLSVHAHPRDWDTELGGGPNPWYTHAILQNKIKELPIAADFSDKNYWIAGRVPVINDELAYEGAGDGWSEADVIEAALGAFLGGGYLSTAYKDGHKTGHYFDGGFNALEHSSANDLLWLRERIDEEVPFWKMAPHQHVGHDLGLLRRDPTRDVSRDFRMLRWPGHAYAFGTNHAQDGLQLRLPEGTWDVLRFDVIEREEEVLHEGVEGEVDFDVPEGRANLFLVRRADLAPPAPTAEAGHGHEGRPKAKPITAPWTSPKLALAEEIDLAALADSAHPALASHRVRGGRFTDEGWQAEHPWARFVLELADGFAHDEAGAVELDVTNFDYDQQADGRKQHFFSLYADPSGDQFRLRNAFFTLRGGGHYRDDDGRPGIKVLWRGEFIRGEKAPFAARADWDPDRTYTWRAEWTSEELVVFLDGERVFGPAEFADRDREMAMKHVFLSTDGIPKSHVWYGMAGPVYQALRLYREPEARASGGAEEE